MTDADLTFQERNFNRHNEAEIYAEKWFVDNEYKFVKYGFDEKHDKVEKDIWFKLPQFIRSTPDYIVLGKNLVFVEVKGYRKEIKLKMVDIQQYKKWQEELPLFVFLRNFDTGENTWLSYESIMEQLPSCRTGVYEDNGQEYYILEEEY